MKNNLFKKSMSVFLAVLMILSCWVWVPGEHNHVAAVASNVRGVPAIRGSHYAGTTAAYGTPVFDGNLDRWFKFHNKGSDYVKISYPSNIYLDKSETLQSAGYFFNVDWAFGNSSDYRILIGAPALGDNSAYSGYPDKYYTMTNCFTGYGFDSSVPSGGAKKVYNTSTGGTDYDLRIVGYGHSTQGSDGFNYDGTRHDKYVLYRSYSGNPNTATIYLLGTPNGEYDKKEYNTTGDSLGSYGFQQNYQSGRNSGWKENNNSMFKQKSYDQANDGCSSYYEGQYAEMQWFVTVYDKSALNTVITNANNLLTQKGKYTTESLNNLQNVLNANKGVLTTRATNQKSINDAKNNIQAAIDNLVEFGVAFDNLFNFNEFTIGGNLTVNERTDKGFTVTSTGDDGNTGFSKAIPVVPGKTYILSADVGITAVSGGYDMYIHTLDANQAGETTAVPDTSNGAHREGDVYISLTGQTTNSTPYIRFTAGSNTKFVKIRFDANATGNKLTVNNIRLLNETDYEGVSYVPTKMFKNNASLGTSFTVPTRTGYTFNRWYADNDVDGMYDSGEEVTDANGNIVSALSTYKIGQNWILYSDWTEHTYSIAFNANGGSGSTAGINNVLYSANTQLTANGFSRTGYTFTGWNTKADGTGTAIADGATVSKLTATNGATVTLYAQWSINKYTIKFVNTEGTIVSTKKYDYNTPAASITKPANTASNYDETNHYTYSWPTINTVTDNVTYTEVKTTTKHNMSSSVTTQATCTTDGVRTYKCSGCGYSYTEAISATGHSWSEATCTTPKTCSVCHTTEGSALDHEFSVFVETVAYTCTDGGYDVYKCSRCTETTHKNPTNAAHTLIQVAAQKETCGAAGWNAYEYCSKCDYTTKVEIPASGNHTYVYTQNDDSKTHTGTCSVCNGTISGNCAGGTANCTDPAVCSTCNSPYDDALGHTEGEAVKENNVPATCYSKGSYDEVVYCSVCDKELRRKTVTVDEIAHTPAPAVDEVTKKASCNEDGTYNEVVYCSVENCGAQISSVEKTITKRDHNYSDWYYASEDDKPTYTKTGTETSKCQNEADDYYEACEHTITREVNKVEDTTAPTGTITYKTTAWDRFLETITFGIYTSEDVELTIKAEDKESGIEKIEYIISDTAIKEEDVTSLTGWTDYTDSITIAKVDAEKKVAYAKITNTQGGVKYLSTDGFVFDLANPVIEITSTDCTTATITVNEANVATVTVDGVNVTLTDGKYTINGEGTHEIVVTDKAGHSVTSNVTIYGHTEGEAVKENNVPATCEGNGSYDNVVYCTKCNEKLSRETVEIAATGHNYSAKVTTRPELVNGTWTEGTYTYTCNNDNSHTYTEPAPRADYTEFDKAVADLEALKNNSKVTGDALIEVNNALAKAEALAKDLVVSEQKLIEDVTKQLNKSIANVNAILNNAGQPQPVIYANSGLKTQFFKATGAEAIESLQLNENGGFDPARLKLTNNNATLPITVVSVTADKANIESANGAVIDVNGSLDLAITAPSSFNETGVITYTVTYKIGSDADGYLMNADKTPVEFQTEAYIYVKGAAFTPYHLMDEDCSNGSATSEWDFSLEAAYGDFELIHNYKAPKADFGNNNLVVNKGVLSNHSAYDYENDSCFAECSDSGWHKGDAHAATYRYYIDTSLAPTWQAAGFKAVFKETKASNYDKGLLNIVRLATNDNYVNSITGTDKTFSVTQYPSATSNVLNMSWSATSKTDLTVSQVKYSNDKEYIFGQHLSGNATLNASNAEFSGEIPKNTTDAKLMYSSRMRYIKAAESIGTQDESVTMTTHLYITSYDKGELRAAINAAELAAYNRNYFTTESWDAYNAALKNAKEVLGKAETTQSEVNEKLAALNTAVTNLTAAEARAKYVLTLTDSIHEGADRNSEATGTQVSYFLLAKGTEFTPALDAEIIALETINKYDDAAKLAINGTTEHTYYYWFIDYSEVDEALDKADEILENKDDYSEEFIKKVTEAKEALEKIKNETKTNTPESQKTVDDAIKEVTDLTGHTCDKNVVIPAVDPTCTNTGLAAGAKCSFCNKITVEQEVVSALGHDWKATTYNFAADGKSCTAARECQRDNCDVTETATATITSDIKTPATCIVMGTTTYTATFTETWAAKQTLDVTDIAINADNHVGSTYTKDENVVAGTCVSEKTWNEVTYCSDCKAKLSSVAKTGAIDANNHTKLNKTDAVEETCEKDGNINYWTCEGCGKIYSDEAATTEITQKDTVIAAKGHNYGAWTYDADGKHKRVCANDGSHVETEVCADSATDNDCLCDKCSNLVAHNYGEATCEAPATCTVCGATTGDKLGHDWKAATYSFAADGSSCTAARECKRTGCDATETATAKITSAVKTPATCIEMGTTTYTATFTETWAAKQTLDVTDIAINADNHVGSTYTKDENVVAGTCVSEKTWNEVTYCSDCKAKLSSVAKTGAIDANNHTKLNKTDAVEETCEKDGNINYWTCEGCKKIYSDAAATTEIAQKDTVIAAKGHNYGAWTYDTDGKHKRVCENDGSHVETEACADSATDNDCLCDKCSNLVAHNYGEATCEAPATCTVCGATTGDKLGHDWDEGVVTKEPNCTTKGEKTFTCKNDNSHTKTEDVAALDHIDEDNNGYCDRKDCGKLICDHKGQDTVLKGDKEATCLEEGYTGDKHCAKCDVIVEYGKKIGALGHDWAATTYNFAADGKSCTAKRECQRDNCDATETATAAITSAVKTPATCIEMGTTTYTATFTETWAAKQTLDVKDIAINPDNHDLKTTSAKAPTCTDIGWDEYVTCQRVDCGYTTYKVIPANGHKYNSAWTPSDEAGKHYRDCTVCGEAGREIVACTESDWIISVNATCMEEGSQYKKCTVCQRTDLATETINKINHNYVGEIKNSKEGYHVYKCTNLLNTHSYCTEYGNEEKCSGGVATCTEKAVCEKCNTKYGSINSANHVGETYTQDEDIVAGTCVSKKTWNEVTYCSDCNAKLNTVAKTGAIDSANHINKTSHKETAATCLTVGYTAGIFCEDCDKWISGHEEIPAIGHKNKVHHEKIDATCIAGGTIEYWSCPDCNKNFSDEACTNEVTDLKLAIDKNAHSWNDWTQTTAPTCSAAGEDTRTCKHNEEHKETRPVDIVADAHKWETEYTTDIEPKCETTGSKSYHCEYCDAINEASKTEIPATGHDWDEGVVTTKPNCTTKGEKTFTCKNDSSHTKTEDVAALDHIDKNNDGYCDRENCKELICDHVGQDTVLKSDKKATCLAEGYTGDKHCAKCDVIVEYGEKIGALGHSWKATTYNFAADGSSCTATRECQRTDCGKKETATAKITSAVKTPATCTVMGTTTYTATFTETWAAKQTLDVTDIAINANNHTKLNKTDAVEETCEKDGNINYWTCEGCGKIYSDETATTEITEAETVIAAKGHDYGEWTYDADGKHKRVCANDGSHVETEACADSATDNDCLCDKCTNLVAHNYGEATCEAPATCTVCGATTGDKLGHDWADTTYNFAADGSSCTATRECQRTGCDEKETATAKITSAVKTPATCIEMGTTTYTATFTETWAAKQALDVQDIAINADNHTKLNKTDAVEETCEKDGNINYWTCEGCGKIYSDAAAKTEIAQKDTVIAAKGHNYGAWTYDANGNHKRVCANDGSHVETEACADSATDNDCLCDKCSNLVAHNYGEATCEAPATCTVCGATTGNKLGHNYTVFVKTVPYTCTEKGYDIYKCSRCDATENKNYTDAAHKLIQVDAKAPSCTEDGYKAYEYCSACNYTTYEVDPKLNHSYNSVVTAPTCTADGYTTYTCSRCDSSYVSDKVGALGHSLGEWTTTTAATCTADGEERRDCIRCDVFETKLIPSLGHSYTSSVTTAPTCTSEGVRTYVCTNDASHTYTETISKTPHKDEEPRDAVCDSCGTELTCLHPETELRGQKTASCLTEGYTGDTYCKICGDILANGTYIPVTDHTFGERPYTVLNATCISERTEIYKCENCTTTKKEVRDEDQQKYAPHTLIIITELEPTCDKNGFNVHYCTYCSTNVRVETIDPTGHVDKDGDGTCDVFGCGGKLNPSEGNDDSACTCLCHKEGWFWGIIYKIVRFIWKLFKISKTCACGNIHY